jgi:hypothetical protein
LENQLSNATVHATSKTLEGKGPIHYITYNQTVIGVWSHNPTISRASDGTVRSYSCRQDMDRVFMAGSGMPPPQSCGPSGCCTHGTSPCGIHQDHPCNQTSTSPPWPQPDPDPAARNPLSAYEN